MQMIKNRLYKYINNIWEEELIVYAGYDKYNKLYLFYDKKNNCFGLYKDEFNEYKDEKGRFKYA